MTGLFLCEETTTTTTMMDEDQLEDVIHRWRNSSEDELKPEDYDRFRTLGSACLTGNGSDRLLEFLQKEENQVMVASMGHVLVAPLVNEIVKGDQSPDLCQAALTHLTTICRAQDLLQRLLHLLQDVDAAVISETVLTVLPHVHTVLLRLEVGRSAGLGLALTLLQRQLTRLPVPYTPRQEDEDQLGLCRCCGAATRFVESFTAEATRGDDDDDEDEDEGMKAQLLTFCLKSLKEPVLEAQFHHNRKSSLWLFAKQIMVTLTVIEGSVSELLLRRRPLVDKDSRACVSYLLFVQLLTMDRFPSVFSPAFILQCNMEPIAHLLSSKKESHLLKGLALFTNSLQRVEDDSLMVNLLEIQSFSRAAQNLRCVVTECPMKHLRSAALQLIQLFILKLDVQAKHKFFRCMLKTSNHSGVEGYIVKNVKDQVESAMKPGGENPWFLGVRFVSLLDLVLSLPQGPETDLLHGMDRVMESLNLLRFLVIRDKDLSSKTDVWAELCRIQERYLKMLRVCISLSRAYYSAELKALRDERRLKAREAREASRSTKLTKRITVRCDNGSNTSPEVQHQVLQCALVTFDLMESLIVRIEEIAEEKLKVQNKL